MLIQPSYQHTSNPNWWGCQLVPSTAISTLKTDLTSLTNICSAQHHLPTTAQPITYQHLLSTSLTNTCSAHHLPTPAQHNITYQHLLSPTSLTNTCSAHHLPTPAQHITYQHLLSPTSLTNTCSAQHHLPTSAQPNITYQHLLSTSLTNTCSAHHLPTPAQPITYQHLLSPTSLTNTCSAHHLPTSAQPNITYQHLLSTTSLTNICSAQHHLPTPAQPNITYQHLLSTSLKNTCSAQHHLPTAQHITYQQLLSPTWSTISHTLTLKNFNPNQSPSELTQGQQYHHVLHHHLISFLDYHTKLRYSKCGRRHDLFAPTIETITEVVLPRDVMISPVLPALAVDWRIWRHPSLLSILSTISMSSILM